MTVGIHQAGEAGAVGGGGHRLQAQLRPQHLAQIQAKRERQIGSQRALVDFVEDDRRHAFQPGIGLQAADQQPFGNDFDPCRRGRGAVDPCAIADRTTNRLTQQRGHPGGGGAGRQAARLQYQDFAVTSPGRGQANSSGTRVVLPAPGGATSTASWPAAKAAAPMPGRASVTRQCR